MDNIVIGLRKKKVKDPLVFYQLKVYIIVEGFIKVDLFIFLIFF